MFRYFLFFLLAGICLASEINLSSPTKVVQSYYAAINEGDLDALKKIMVEESYDTDIQIYALSIALKDPKFHAVLKRYSESQEAKQAVQRAVAKKLSERKDRTISIKQEVSLGDGRVMVKFTEDSKNKQLYLSHEGDEWKINYLAGRKTN